MAFSHIRSHILILVTDCQNVFNVPDSQELEFFYFVKSNFSLKQQEKKNLNFYSREQAVRESPHR